MAQAGSVQREPSMEEILASIRRIIEDSDSAQGQAADATAAGLQESAEDDFDHADDVEEFRAELKPASQRPDNAVSELRPSNTFADPLEAAIEPELSAAEPARSSVLDWPVNDWSGEPAGNEPETSADLPRNDPAAAASPGQEEKEHDSDETSERRPAIISELAERKIAAAFDELSEAFETSRRQSLDEMAEEMLRPMLQDWLDNNLPRLVEKLVREEIERVARGAAR